MGFLYPLFGFLVGSGALLRQGDEAARVRVMYRVHGPPSRVAGQWRRLQFDA